jgi:hypothetical protein
VGVGSGPLPWARARARSCSCNCCKPQGLGKAAGKGRQGQRPAVYCSHYHNRGELQSQSAELQEIEIRDSIRGRAER